MIQVIGCAYTYNISTAVRTALSRERANHSSHQGDKAFSFFKKVDSIDDIVKAGGFLQLRTHPQTGKEVNHWYEPELAILLGNNHTITRYALANDLTASEIEFEKSTEGYDPTYYGKVWKGSCALGEFALLESENIEIGLRIQRGKMVYDRKYQTVQRKRDFTELPFLILEYQQQLREKCRGILPVSKQIQVDLNGFLPAGTVILTGTGIITPPRWYAQVGDLVTVYSDKLNELTNTVKNYS